MRDKKLQQEDAGGLYLDGALADITNTLVKILDNSFKMYLMKRLNST